MKLNHYVERSLHFYVRSSTVQSSQKINRNHLCPSTDDKKMKYMYTREHYLAIKIEIQTFMVLSEINEAQKTSTAWLHW